MTSMMIGKDGKLERNKSKVALTRGEQCTKDVVLKNLEGDESRCALLANLMVSSGIPGKVSKIIQKRSEFHASLLRWMLDLK